MRSRPILAAIVMLTVVAGTPKASSQVTQGTGARLRSGESNSTQRDSTQKDDPSRNPTTAQAENKQAETEEQIRKREQSQRILKVVPMFGVTSRRNPPPLTPSQKFHLFVKGTVDPFNCAIIGVQAGISQAQNNFPQYGQGAAGFGKRYGAALADSTSTGFFAGFVFPVMLRHDPRYFRLGEGSLQSRIAYSLAQEFVGHKDSGGRTVNWSNIMGGFAAGGLSNLYYPSDDRGFGLTMSRVAISFVYGSAGGLLSEFWPDIDRKVLHKKKANQPGP